MKRPFYWIFAVLAAVFAFLLVGPGTATALPPGGASGNTPGTSSTVSPGTLKAGDTLSFTLSGFPADEQVYIKIDNGDACPSDAAQGACVVHQQKTDGKGSATGSFVLPTDLAEGEHTLRFLATEVMRDSSGAQIGTSGYSNQSPAFTVTGVNQDSEGANYTNVDAEVINQIEEAAEESNGGGAGSGENAGSGSASTTVRNEETVYLDADGNEVSKEEYDRLVAEAEEAAAATEPAAGEQTGDTESEESTAAASSETGTPAATESAGETESAVDATQETGESTSSSVPWVGIIAFGAAALAAVIIVVRRRSAG